MPRYPYIAQGALYPAEGSGPISIGSPAWFAWIREHTTFAYQDEHLRFTARLSNAPVVCTGMRISVLMGSCSNGVWSFFSLFQVRRVRWIENRC